MNIFLKAIMWTLLVALATYGAVMMVLICILLAKGK